MSWHNIGSEILKPTLKFIGAVIIPLTTATILWNSMNNLVTVLALILLTTLILKQWGADVKILTRFANTRIGKGLLIMIRSGSMITKINEEYFEETSEIIVDGTKALIEQGKKIKEEIKMSKLKGFQERGYLILKYNKRLILGNLALMLLAADVYFGISIKYGLPPDAANILAGFIFTLLLIVMGGEGWTGNLINRVRENAAIAKAEAHKKTKEYRRKLAEVDKEAKAILKRYGIEGVLPEAIKPDYAKLMNTIKEYEDKIKEILDKIETQTAE